MKKLLCIISFLVAMVATSVAGAQPAPASCRPSASYCNALAGIRRSAPERFINQPASPAAAALSACTAADQPALPVCEANLLRANSTPRTIATVEVGEGEQAVVRGRTQTIRTYTTVRQRDPRVGQILERIALLERMAAALGNANEAQTGVNEALTRAILEARRLATAALEASDEASEDAERALGRANVAIELALRALRAAQNAQQTANDAAWQVNNLRDEFRLRFTAVPVNYTWRSGGSPTFGTAGVGFGLTRWGQGSSLGFDVDMAFHFYETQPLAPGRAPLFGASAGVRLVLGRGSLQGLLGIAGSMAFRPGKAMTGEVRGTTAFGLGFGGGLRYSTPLYPESRPRGPQFFVQGEVYLGFGGSTVLAQGVEPNRFGLAVMPRLVLGFAL